MTEDQTLDLCLYALMAAMIIIIGVEIYLKRWGGDHHAQ